MNKLLFFLFFLLTGIASTFYTAYVIVQGYNWFLLPFGLPEISTLLVVGVIYLSYLIQQSQFVTLIQILNLIRGEETPTESVVNRLIVQLTYVLTTSLTWFILWILRGFL